MRKAPSLLQALTPIIALMILICANVILCPDDTLGGANQLSLLIASGIGVAIAVRGGIKWDDILDKMSNSVVTAMPSILILLSIGMLSGTWMLSGIVPTMIYYGLEFISPHFFLPAAIIFSALISVTIGSSWSTIATVGVALLGIGTALGFNEAVVAGAIISGAYFGDKISPLSDTTTLASAVTKVPLFTHIRHMMQTTIPSFIIAVLIFIGISLFANIGDSEVSSTDIQGAIETAYTTSPLLLIVPLIVLVMIYKRLPTLVVLITGALLGAVAAIIAQPDMLLGLSEGGGLTIAEIYKVITHSMYGSTSPIITGTEMDSLFSTGGMIGMLNTVWLIIMSMVFGGVLEAGNFLEVIIVRISKKVDSVFSAVGAASGSTMLFNLVTGDQYISIVIPGKMFAPLFHKLRLRPELLSRTLEDSGTVTSVLIPWNTCGATQAAILGVATMSYAPFAFFCYISPLMTLIFAWFKIKIKPLDDEEDRAID